MEIWGGENVEMSFRVSVLIYTARVLHVTQSLPLMNVPELLSVSNLINRYGSVVVS